MSNHLKLLSLCAVLLAACGGGSSGPSATSPAIVSITPANGTKGVPADAKITVTFSKPMNQSTTQAAYQSGDLPASGVSFSWNADSTVMTVKPNAPLAYARGATFALVAKGYNFSLTGDATDKSGNRLGLTNSAFTTLREITFTVPMVPTLVGYAFHKGNVDGYSPVSRIPVGDSSENEGVRGYLTFDLSSIPTDSGTAPISATVSLTKERTYGSPYLNLNPCVPTSGSVCASPYVPMNLDHVAFGLSISSVYRTPVLHGLGAIATYQSSDKLKASVLVAVNDDLANRVSRGHRSQYRLSFPLESNNDDGADGVHVDARAGTLESPFITVEYQIP